MPAIYIGSELELYPLQDEDIAIVEAWIRQDYVLKWYEDADEWIHEMKERTGQFSFLRHFIVYKDSIPFAFCQYYDCYYAQEDWYEVERLEQAYSIDYLIGVKGYLGKGHGKAIVKALIDIIKRVNESATIIVQPEEDNIASCKSLLTNGFVYDDEKEYYIYK